MYLEDNKDDSNADCNTDVCSGNRKEVLIFNDIGNKELFFVGPWSAKMETKSGKKLIKISNHNPKHHSYLIAQTKKGLLKPEHKYRLEVQYKFEKSAPGALLELVCRSLKNLKSTCMKTTVKAPEGKAIVDFKTGAESDYSVQIFGFKPQESMITGIQIFDLGDDSHLDSPYAVSGKFRGDGKTIAKELAGLRQIGINWRRTDFDWWSCEREKGKWNFSRMDNDLAEAEKYGINLLPILTWEPQWAVPAIKHLDQWSEYVRRVASRYNGRIKYLEIWNEQNSIWRGSRPSGKDYAKLLVRTYKEIKAAAPDIKVGYGGCSGDGIPLHFMENSFWLGAAKHCDFICFHPYHWRGVPEMIIDNVTALKALMKKYHIDHKPIWITEVGWSTSVPVPFYDKIIPAVFKKLEIDPSRTTIALLCDYENGADGPSSMLPEQNFKAFKKIKMVTFAEISKLDIKKYPVLVPSYSEYFPEDKIPLLVDYVRRGGTIFLTSGLPFYYSYRPYEGKGLHTAQINSKNMKDFHMGWEAWWTRKGVPRSVKFYQPAAEFKNDFKLKFRNSTRFLTSINLKPGDKFIPVIESGTDNFKGAVMGIYKLNSDLKGNVVVCLDKLDYDSVSEQTQAEFLTRTYLCALSSGVEKIFWYTYRDIAAIKGREGGFGIINSDFSPKPALAAYKTLIKLCPDGSTIPMLKKQGNIYITGWQTPDARRIWGVWTTASKPVQCKLTIEGKIDAIYNISGDKQNISVDRTYNLSGSIVYLVGPSRVSVLSE